MNNSDSCYALHSRENLGFTRSMDMDYLPGFIPVPVAVRVWVILHLFLSLSLTYHMPAGLEGPLAGHACMSDHQHWSHCLSDLLAPGAFSTCLDSLGLAELRDHRRAFYGVEFL